MYDHKARQELMDKLDYELWLLNKLAEYQIFDGGTDITTLKIAVSQRQVFLDSGEELVTCCQLTTLMTPLVLTPPIRY